MAAKPLTTKAIELTEKKMDMSLDDIIKMSKPSTNKNKKQRVPNRSQNFLNNASLDKSAKMRRFLDSRSSIRQGALAQKRSNFRGNQFPLASEAARKAAVAPIRSRGFNRSRAMNMNIPRVGAQQVQRGAANGNFALKHQQQRQQRQPVKVSPTQRPQTLDSLFANMKERRMRGLSPQSNGGRRNGGEQQRPPWSRSRFNF